MTMRFAASAVLGAGLVLSSLATAQEKVQLSIGTGGTGGVYYPLGGGIANVLSKHVPGMSATAEVTGGSVDNLKLVASGKPYLAMTMADAGQDAFRGEDKFKGNKVPLRTLMIMYPNRMHVVTIEGTGINSLADLKGKRVSTGSPGSATEVMGFRVIEAAGLDRDKDMRRERLGVAESVNAIKDKKIDAFFWVGGLPTAAVTDLANTPGVRIKLIDHVQVVAPMNKKYGQLYFEDTIPKATYQGHGDRQQERHGVEHPRLAREHERRRRLQHREDDLREARGPHRRAPGGGELQARAAEGVRDADPLPPRGAEVLRREGRQGQLTAPPWRRRRSQLPPSRSSSTSRRSGAPRPTSRRKRAPPTG